MERYFHRRLDKIGAQLGVGVIPCTCQPGDARGELAASLLALPLFEGELNDEQSMDPDEVTEGQVALQEVQGRPRTPCSATIHYWHDDYISPMALSQSGVAMKIMAAVAVLFPDGIPTVPANVATVFEEPRIKVSDEEISLADLAPKPKPLDPLIAKITARINKLRPGTVDPGDDDYDSEKWLKLPTDK